MNHSQKRPIAKHILLSIALLGLTTSCAKAVDSPEVTSSSKAIDAPKVTEVSNTVESTAVDSAKEAELSASSTSLAPQCERLTDFETSEKNDEWAVVNDNIMGGRSLGGPEFGDSVMTFSGYINTNGGGFSSVRKTLEPNVLSNYSRVEIRLKPDGRSYRLILEDSLETRSSPTVHRKNIEFGPTGEWQTVSVPFDQLQPSVFGDPVEAPRFRQDLASRIGLMLNDVGDGPFQLEIDWIDVCS